MIKTSFNPRITAYPMPVCLVGVNVNQNPNFMAVAWTTKVNSNPPMMMISLGKNQYTSEGIKKNRTFSINFPGKDMIIETDYCGLVSGRDLDKSTIFKIFYGELKTAPMIDECPVCFELKLVEMFELPGTIMFVGEIISAYADEECLIDKKPDVVKMAPFLLVESPTSWYVDLGSHVAKAFNVGKKLKK